MKKIIFLASLGSEDWVGLIIFVLKCTVKTTCERLCGFICCSCCLFALIASGFSFVLLCFSSFFLKKKKKNAIPFANHEQDDKKCLLETKYCLFQTPARALVAIACPVQLFFGPQLVLRPIFRQLSMFVTTSICGAFTFPRAHGMIICMHLGAESTRSKIEQNFARESDNTQMPTYNKTCINCALTGAHQHSPAAFCLQLGQCFPLPE